MRQTRDAVPLRDQRRSAHGDDNAGRRRDHRHGLALGTLEEMDQPDRLSRLHIATDVDEVLVHAGLRREAIVLAIERLHPAYWLRARDLRTLDDAEVNEHVAQAALREPMHRRRDDLAAAHFGRDDGLALSLR